MYIIFMCQCMILVLQMNNNPINYLRLMEDLIEKNGKFPRIRNNFSSAIYSVISRGSF